MVKKWYVLMLFFTFTELLNIFCSDSTVLSFFLGLFGESSSFGTVVGEGGE